MIRRISTAVAAFATITLLIAASAPSASASVIATCGDGCVEGGETCDDGNSNSLDGCSEFCVTESCYNCGALAASGRGACSPQTCTLDTVCQTCGNGCVDSGETCDDGNTNALDGCDSRCNEESCYICTEIGVSASGRGPSCSASTCSPDLKCSCGNETCDTWESCETCSFDCGPCSTTTTTDTTTTTVIVTTTTDTTTTTEQPTGACCTGTGCFQVTQGLCQGEYLGTYHGDESSCDEPLICVNCGNGCKDFGESCDDGNTDNGDGCDEDCAEENCFNCSPPPTDTIPQNVIGPVCMGPYTCSADPACDVCGDNEIGESEDCDDGNTANGDCCSANCQFDASGSSCTDHQFCNGAETCDGEGTCQPGSPVSCTNLTTQCAVGVCNEASDSCVADTEAKDGDPCNDDSTCTVPGTGVCLDGTCTGQGTTLSPTCRWIIVGGPADTGRSTKVRNGEDSIIRASTCGQTGRSSGKTLGSLVVTADVGEGVRFDALAEVGADIVTGGASMTSSLYAVIPGTLLTGIAAGAPAVDKMPSGKADASGTNPLFDVCLDDQAKLTLARPILDAKTTIPAHMRDLANFKVPVGSSQLLDITGHGLEIIDMSSFRVARKSTLTLKGGPTDVLMIRVGDGRFSVGFGAKIVLDGLKPGNVLFYSQATRACRLSKRATGGGTVFCPDASKIIVGVNSHWTGTFLAAKREVRVRFYADLTHEPFTGF